MLKLTPKDRAMLNGEFGKGTQMAMRIISTMADVFGARSLLDIESAHIDGCLYHGESGIRFAQQLVDGHGRVTVPTTLNVGAIDLIHPEFFQGSKTAAERGALLMKLYEKMGCQPVWTCTPYQTMHRPSLGAQIAWAESNAIVFANSVLGARTNRYGDFIDICAALTGRAPATGLHLTQNRRAQRLFSVEKLPQYLLESDVFYPVLGYYLGQTSQGKIPAIVGLPGTVTEDQLKALGAAAASSGALALFHAVGITPEAQTITDAFQGESPTEGTSISFADLKASLAQLSTVPDGRIDAVALGSPHFSMAEFAALLPLIQKMPPSPQVDFIVCTNRLALTGLKQKGWLTQFQQAGIRIVVDTCVVVAPILKAQEGVLMTNSGKFAHYTPGNTGLNVVFGSLEECVQSAAIGHVWRDEHLWV